MILRNKYRISNLTIKELIESFLKELSFYYTLENTIRGDFWDAIPNNYNSCEFNIKELPGWRFGVWSTDTISKSYFSMSKNQLIFFAQYEKDIDKFKPSRTALKCNLLRQRYEEGNDDKGIHLIELWDFSELLRLLQFIKEHKFVARWASWQCNFQVWDYIPFYICAKKVILEDLYNFKQSLKENFKLFKAYRDSKRKLTKICKKYHVPAMIIKESDNWFPRLHVIVYSENHEKLEDVDFAIDKYQNYIRKNYIIEIDFTWCEDLDWFNKRKTLAIGNESLSKNDEDKEVILWMKN